MTTTTATPCPCLPTREATSRADTRRESLASRLNWLRAAVLGANDGIVSIAGLVVGVAAADPTNKSAIALAGLAGIASAASSMAVGEYVSVSTQRDSEREVVARERALLASDPAGQLAKLAASLENAGLPRKDAWASARALSERAPLNAHLALRYRIDEDDLTNPWHAAAGSFLAFLAGSALPLAAILLFPPALAVGATMVAVVLALTLTGVVSAWLGQAPKMRAAARLLAGGILAMGLGYGIGHLFT